MGDIFGLFHRRCYSYVRCRNSVFAFIIVISICHVLELISTTISTIVVDICLVVWVNAVVVVWDTAVVVIWFNYTLIMQQCTVLTNLRLVGLGWATVAGRRRLAAGRTARRRVRGSGSGIVCSSGNVYEYTFTHYRLFSLVIPFINVYKLIFLIFICHN